MKRNLLCWLLLATPAAVEAQFNYTVTNGTIIITGYVGTNSIVEVPSSINGLPVTSIGMSAFYYCTNLTGLIIPNSVTDIGLTAFDFCTSLTSITIPNSVTNIGGFAFYYCTNLTSVTVPNSITSIGPESFAGCASLISITIPNSVTNIGYSAFSGCSALTNVTIPNSVISIGSGAFGKTGLTSVTIPDSVTSIGDQAFSGCSSLTGIYFQGNAPSLGANVFAFDKATAYYLPGTVGWFSSFGGFNGTPIGFWILPYPVILNRSLGVRSNQLNFTVSWAAYVSVVVEASTTLSNPVWQPLQTNALNNGVLNFFDPGWINYPNRFYRVRAL